MNYKISIIIPVYNVEKYLKQCIESIVNQKYPEKEIILVDDGSTDFSGQICDDYANKYDFIKAVHTQNGGASVARNTGVSYADGDYILFIDSDDFIEENSIEKMTDIIKNNPVDLVFLEAQKYIDEKTIPLGDGITKVKVKNKSRADVLDFLAVCPKFAGSPCTKLIKRQLFIDNDLTFEAGLLSEDIDWCLKLFLSADTFDYCPDMHYNYRQGRVGSASGVVSRKHFSDTLYILKKWAEKITEYDEHEKNFILSALSYEYLILVYFYSKIDKADKKEFYREISGLQWLLKHRNGIKYKCSGILCRVLGVRFTARLIKCFQKIRAMKIKRFLNKKG